MGMRLLKLPPYHPERANFWGFKKFNGVAVTVLLAFNWLRGCWLKVLGAAGRRGWAIFLRAVLLLACHRERGAVLLLLFGGGLLSYWLADCSGLLLILMGAAAVLLVRGYGRGAGMVMGRDGAKKGRNIL